MYNSRIRSCIERVEKSRQDRRRLPKRTNDEDSINDSLYSVRLKSELDRLRTSSEQSQIDATKLHCLPYILAVDQLESTNHQSYQLADTLLKQEEQLKTELSKEKSLNDQLSQLNELLNERLETIGSLTRSQSPKNILNELEQKKNASEKTNKSLLIQLKQLLNKEVLETIATDDDPDLKNIRSELRRTIENLLNEMFEQNSTGYVHIADMDSPIIHFLLSGDLITIHPDDPSYIRLRDFGK